jgi:hypothetical protein
MSRWNATIRSALVTTVALMVVVGALATANAAPDPAKRYRAVQITEEDVILQEPQMQVILQNDDFHRMLLAGDLDEVLGSEILPWNFETVRQPPTPTDGGLHQAYRPPASGLNRAYMPPSYGARWL